MTVVVYMGSQFIHIIRALEIKSSKKHHTLQTPNQVKEDLRL